MILKLYKNEADKRVVDKTDKFTLLHEFNNVILKKDTSVMTPTYEVHSNIDDLNIFKQGNYIYDETNKQYYYITNFVHKLGGILEIQCKEDVLMTYKDELLSNTCTVKRNESKANGYIVDNEFVSLAYKNYVTKKFPYTFSEESLILMTVG